MSISLEGVFEKATFYIVEEFREAVIQTGLKRIRPRLLTLSTTVLALMPIFRATGRGVDAMQPDSYSLGAGE